jgi:ribosomal subunit interface protein
MVATRLDKRIPSDRPQQFAFELHCPEKPCPRDLTEYVHAKLLAKMAKFTHHITEVIVHLRDVERQRPRRGVDTACHIEVRLAGREPVNVAERDEDVRAAIDLTVERTVEAVHRHLERTRSKRLSRGRKLVQRSKTAT